MFKKNNKIRNYILNDHLKQKGKQPGHPEQAADATAGICVREEDEPEAVQLWKKTAPNPRSFGQVFQEPVKPKPCSCPTGFLIDGPVHVKNTSSCMQLSC